MSFQTDIFWGWQILLPYNLFTDYSLPTRLSLSFCPARPWFISQYSMCSETGFPSWWVLSQKKYQKKDTDVYSRLLDSEGEGEGGMIWENGIETCILSCKNRITSLCPKQDTACLGLVQGDDPEGCCGEGGGRGVHVWEHMYTHGAFISMYGKTNTVL